MQSVLEREIRLKEDELTRATRALDIEALDRLYADDVLMTGVLDATCTKSAIMAELQRGVAERNSVTATAHQLVTSYDKEDLAIAIHGETAISACRFVFTATGGSVDVHRRHRTTNVWIKRQGRWQIVAAHTSFALDAKQAAMLFGEER